MPYSIDSFADDCYDGTTCLKNKYNIKDENILKDLETTITFSRIAEYILNPLFHTYDVDHYKNIHRYIFDDLYEWSGTYRTIAMSKKGTVFAKPENITFIIAY